MQGTNGEKKVFSGDERAGRAVAGGRRPSEESPDNTGRPAFRKERRDGGKPRATESATENRPPLGARVKTCGKSARPGAATRRAVNPGGCKTVYTGVGLEPKRTARSPPGGGSLREMTAKTESGLLRSRSFLFFAPLHPRLSCLENSFTTIKRSPSLLSPNVYLADNSSLNF